MDTSSLSQAAHLALLIFMGCTHSGFLTATNISEAEFHGISEPTNIEKQNNKLTEEWHHWHYKTGSSPSTIFVYMYVCIYIYKQKFPSFKENKKCSTTICRADPDLSKSQALTSLCSIIHLMLFNVMLPPKLMLPRRTLRHVFNKL
jgi:hypothetical protein